VHHIRGIDQVTGINFDDWNILLSRTADFQHSYDIIDAYKPHGNQKKNRYDIGLGSHRSEKVG